VTPPPGRLGRLLVHPRSPHARRGEPLTAGLPLPRGWLSDAERLAVTDHTGRPCPSAARVLERWSDQTIRWALLDVVADVPPQGSYLDVHDGGPMSHPTPLAVQCDGATATVASGGFRVRFDVGTASSLAEVAIDGQVLVATAALDWRVRAADGSACTISWTELDASGATPLAAVITLRGLATTAAGRTLRLSAAWRFFAGRHTADVELELHNPARSTHTGGFWELGDAGSVHLQSAALAIALAGGPVRLRARLAETGEFETFETPFDVTQHASGGANWTSPVHVAADGSLPFDHPGYLVQSPALRRDGSRAEPTIELDTAGGRLAVTAPQFWQVFPKALRVSEAGVVEVAWLPAGTHSHEIQGGERCPFRFALGFGDDGVTDAPLEWRRAPSFVLPDPETAAAAGAVPRLLPASLGRDGAYDQLIGAALDGADTFEAKRERIDEYGWRHFGDLYADHENGPDPATRRVSHYNNQYDAVAGLITQALRTGDPRWWLLADDLARHVTHIDIYWTDQDKAAYNGGLFWHTTHYVDAGRSTHRTYPKAPGVQGGGPSNEHCYSTGLLLHHRLTGSPLSAAAVEGLARWMIAADDGAQAPVPLRWLTQQRTGHATATFSADYHGPGRGPANAVTAMLDAARLTGQRAFLDKAGELVTRVVHPEDDIAALSLSDTERRWSYTVMLQALGRYASDLAERGGHDAETEYARATLRHYARWMADHEFPYLDQPELLEFPTETWAAHDLRKADVFDLAAQWATGDERARFSERARFFHRTALATLADMPTRTRTRPMVLLLSNGFARAWHESRADPLLPAPAAASSSRSWPPRAVFVPQKAVAKKRLVIAAAAAAGVLVLGLLAVLAG
jgi:hypothetical protein